MALTTRITTEVSTNQTSSLDLGTVSFPVLKKDVFDWASGTGANQADRLFTDTRTLAASANEDLDLAGVLLDAFGSAITFVRIKALLVKAASGNTNNVKVKPAAANGWLGPFNAAADTVSVKPGGTALFVAPDATAWPVTAATADLLNIANSGAGSSVTYDIVIVGASA